MGSKEGCEGEAMPVGLGSVRIGIGGSAMKGKGEISGEEQCNWVGEIGEEGPVTS